MIYRIIAKRDALKILEANVHTEPLTSKMTDDLTLLGHHFLEFRRNETTLLLDYDNVYSNPETGGWLKRSGTEKINELKKERINDYINKL